jgi:hypothetical protein
MPRATVSRWRSFSGALPNGGRSCSRTSATGYLAEGPEDERFSMTAYIAILRQLLLEAVRL